jgi:hypothetical protein
MKKLYAFFIVGIILMAATAIAEESGAIEDLVKNALEVRGIGADKVQNVKEVDFNELPEEVTLENIDDTNLAMYEVAVEGEDRPMYIITASDDFFTTTMTKFGQRMLLNFGFSGENVKTTFLKTATGVVTSLEKGYVMTRSGSIVGLSTNLEVLRREGNVPIEVIIFKNSEEVGFRNTFNPEMSGIYNDYDIMSNGAVSFERGDVISLQVTVPEGTSVSDVTSLLEIEASN